MDERTIGDSARNRALKASTSNHVFDEAGEHARYHSDSESSTSRKGKTRYINSAICIESIDGAQSVISLQSLQSESSYEATPHPHSSYRSNSTPFLTGRKSPPPTAPSNRKACKLLDERSSRKDTALSGGETYRNDGHDTFRLSVASLSTTTTANAERQRNEERKREAFNAWLAKKEQERRDKAKQEGRKLRPATRITPEQREASFRRWMETKKKQEEARLAEVALRQLRERERIKNERLRREREKDEKLNDWIHKKEEEIKLMKTREERKLAQTALEEEKRRAQGEQAFRDWLRTSKNKPLPVPLNQGELSMRGSVSGMYVNPVPWQAPI